MTARQKLLGAIIVLIATSLACSANLGSDTDTATPRPEPTSTPEPEPFTSDEGRFSIAFPDEPEEQTQNIPTAVGDVALTMYTVSSGSSAYLAGFADYPADMVAASDPETMLDGGRDGAVSNIDGKLLTEKHITIDGYPGRELKVESNDGKNVLYGRFYLVDSRLYQIMVVTTPDGLDESVIFAFLDSFTLNN